MGGWWVGWGWGWGGGGGGWGGGGGGGLEIQPLNTKKLRS